MSTTDKQLLDSLAGFVNDVKPFHSKLRGFTTEISFTDKVVFRFAENENRDLGILSVFLLNSGDRLLFNSGGWLLINDANTAVVNRDFLLNSGEQLLLNSGGWLLLNN